MNTLLISTVLLNLLFVASAYGKINNFEATSKGLKGVFWIKGLPMWFFKLAIACVIVLLLVAPSVMLYAVFDPSKSIYAVYSCYALIAFTIMATLLYVILLLGIQRQSRCLSLLKIKKMVWFNVIFKLTVIWAYIKGSVSLCN